jgi:hypothetical protein
LGGDETDLEPYQQRAKALARRQPVSQPAPALRSGGDVNGEGSSAGATDGFLAWAAGQAAAGDAGWAAVLRAVARRDEAAASATPATSATSGDGDLLLAGGLLLEYFERRLRGLLAARFGGSSAVGSAAEASAEPLVAVGLAAAAGAAGAAAGAGQQQPEPSWPEYVMRWEESIPVDSATACDVFPPQRTVVQSWMGASSKPHQTLLALASRGYRVVVTSQFYWYVV